MGPGRVNAHRLTDHFSVCDWQQDWQYKVHPDVGRWRIEPNEIIDGTRFIAIPGSVELGFRLELEH